MSPIQAAMEHCRLKADLDAARADGDGWWIQEALGALIHLVEQRHASQSSACGPTAHDSLPRRVPDMLLILEEPRQFPGGVSNYQQKGTPILRQPSERGKPRVLEL